MNQKTIIAEYQFNHTAIAKLCEPYPLTTRISLLANTFLLLTVRSSREESWQEVEPQFLEWPFVHFGRTAQMTYLGYKQNSKSKSKSKSKSQDYHIHSLQSRKKKKSKNEQLCREHSFSASNSATKRTTTQPCRRPEDKRRNLSK